MERDGVKIGLKRATDFASDADTDDMADDSDLDVSTRTYDVTIMFNLLSSVKMKFNCLF